MGLRQALTAAAFSVLVWTLASAAYAATIEYFVANVDTPAKYDEQSGAFRVTGGDAIEFDLTFGIKPVDGAIHYPLTVTFGVQNTDPSGLPASLISGIPAEHEFAPGDSTFTDRVRITAPSVPGAYQVKIGAISGAGTAQGLREGSGIVIGLIVPDACAPADTMLSLALDNPRLAYNDGSTRLAATLTTPEGYAVSGKSIDFKVGADVIGSAETDENGTASIFYNPGTLVVGDHTVFASFQGATCGYNPSGDSATLGVR